MILSKETYYRRRWFLSILFLLLGFWLIYLAYGMFGYNKGQDELKVGNVVPSKILIEKSTDTKNRFLNLFFEGQKITSVIEQEEIDKMISVTGQNELATWNKPINTGGLKNLSFQYAYWKDRLYQLKINNETIIKYQTKGDAMAYIVLVIGLFWTSIQIWAIIILTTKGTSVYDKAFKK